MADTLRYLADLLSLIPPSTPAVGSIQDLRDILVSVMPTGRTSLVVAPSDASDLIKVNADYICLGTADDVKILEALNALPADGGEVVLAMGIFNITDTIHIGTVPGTGDNKSLRFVEGAIVRWTGLAVIDTPLIQVNASNCKVIYPRLRGSGTKGNGIGVKIGKADQDQPGGVRIYEPYIDNMDTGIEFGCQTSGGTGSTGDCSVLGGRIRQVKTGIKSRGFVNHILGGTFISNCDRGVWQTTDRDQGSFNLQQCTINVADVAAIQIDRGRGCFIDQVWIEHKSGLASTAQIILGDGTNTVQNTVIGTIHLHVWEATDTYGIQLKSCRGLLADNIEVTNDLPITAYLRVDNHADNTGNRIRKLTMGDAVPAGFTDAMLLSTASTAFNTIAIDEFVGAANAAKGVTRGADMRPDPAADYTVFRLGANNTYLAKTREGYWAKYAADGATTSGFKAVMAAICPANTTDTIFSFAANTRFHFLDAPLGTEAWAGAQDYGNYVNLRRCTFKGAGWSTIISNRTNYLLSSPDTEPFSFAVSMGIVIKDMTVEGCGAYKSTTDAIDMDQGANCRIENVQIKSSRSFGMTFDGGDDGVTLVGSAMLFNHVKGRPAVPQVALQSGGTLAATTAFQHAIGWRVKDLQNVAITVATHSGGVNTITAVAHGFRVGEEVNITGVTPAGYNGTFSVATVPTVDTFTVADADPGGAGSAFGIAIGSATTKPSDSSESLTTSGNRTIRMTLDPGPYTYTGWDIYRYSVAAGWVFVTTVAASPATLFYDDTGAITGTAVVLTDHRSTVPESAIRLLGAKGSLVQGNVIDGTGDIQRGQSQYGIDLIRKSTALATDPTSSFNRVSGNRIRATGKSGIRVGGGNDNIVVHNEISNPGTVAAKSHGVRLEGITTYTTHRNLIENNVIRDDQVAGSWSGGATTVNGIVITATNTPTANVLAANMLSGSTATPISDSGTLTRIRDNSGYITEAQGTGSIANGATTAVITHGLAYTPTAAEIQITFTENPTTLPVGLPFISAIGATTFTVNVEADPGASGLDFGWLVRKL